MSGEYRLPGHATHRGVKGTSCATNPHWHSVSAIQRRPDDTCVMVISHDCDLAADDLDEEPMLEVIVGRLTTAEGNFRWAKSPRKLHLDISRGGLPAVLELIATERRLVPRADFAGELPHTEFVVDPKGLQTLRTWLGVRYNRPAFSDAFNDRLRSLKLDEKLAQAMKQFDALISGVFFRVDGGQELNRDDGSAFHLAIVLSYLPGDDPDKAAARADEAEARVDEIFRKRCFDAGLEAWAGIQLLSCIAVSEDDLTVSQARAVNSVETGAHQPPCRRGRPNPSGLKLLHPFSLLIHKRLAFVFALVNALRILFGYAMQ